MNAAVINGFNNVVQPDDIVFNLGDVVFGDKSQLPNFLNRLNCKNIYLLAGNHDDWILNRQDMKQLFLGVYEFGLEVSINRKLFVLNHYPLKVWRDNNKGSIHCYGHTHYSLPDDVYAKSLDCGVDSDAYGHKKFSPWSLDEIVDVCNNKKKGFRALDHHR